MTAWEIVRDLIKAKGLSQKQIARRMGRSDNYVGAKIAQGNVPSVSLYREILRAIGGYRLAVVDERGTVVAVIEDE